MDPTDRDNFLATYHIDASNGNVTYFCHTCNATMSIFKANRHMQSMRHLKKYNKGRCIVNLYEFIILKSI